MMTWIVLGVCTAFVLLMWKVSADGPQNWLGYLMCAALIGGVLYQMYLRA